MKAAHLFAGRSIYYCPPEVLANGVKSAHPHSDIWSGALLIMSMYTGEHTWYEITKEKCKDPGKPMEKHMWKKCQHLVCAYS